MRTAIRRVVAAEGSLAAVGLLWASVRDIPIPVDFHLRSLYLALAATAGFIAFNFSLYRLGKRAGHLSGLYAFLEEEVFPLFRGASRAEVVLLVSLAGLGEELLFRGALQQEVGLLPASLIFGLVHGPVRPLLPLAAWASLMGLALGLLYEASGNLVVPALAHALYDGAALAYISSSAGAPPPAEAFPRLRPTSLRPHSQRGARFADGRLSAGSWLGGSAPAEGSSGASAPPAPSSLDAPSLDA